MELLLALIVTRKAGKSHVFSLYTLPCTASQWRVRRVLH